MVTPCLAVLLLSALRAPLAPVQEPEGVGGVGAVRGVQVERLLGVMGTSLSVRVEAAERAAGLAASETALRALEAAEARLSTWVEGSELARFNRSAPGEAIELSPELARELARADHWRRETGGAFDPAVGDLVQLYGARSGGRTPSAAELADALALRADGTALALEGRTARRLSPGLWLEEGGFGKGAGLDAALASLAGAPIHSAALDLGGQVAVFGRPGAAYSFALADPRDRARAVLSYSIDAGSVATSGSSERGSHLIDPRTGRLAPGAGSMTVWAPSALDADCLSTGLFVLGAEAALEFARAREGLEVLVLEPLADGSLAARASAGWLGRIELLAQGVTLEIERGAAARRAEVGAVPAAFQSGGAEQDEDRIARLEARNAELERRIDVVAGEVERFDLGGIAAPIGESEFGMGPAASKVYSVSEGVSLGGYGEALFEDFESSRDDGSSGNTDRADFLRAVLYVGYKFDEHWVFNSELEFEHASTDQSGSASVEFAYVEYLHDAALNARGGLLLVPMGLLNELHEPTTFASAKRPGIENVIIPSTWRENGVGILGELGPFDYKAYVVNGLEGAGFSAGGLRGGRQKGSSALAEDLAFVGRLDWNGVPGLTLGASAYQGDSAQDVSGVDLDTTILEAHLDLAWRGVHLRALAARAELDDVQGLNAAQGLVGPASVGETLEGYYVELGYDLLGVLRPNSGHSLMPFARYETYDTQAEVPGGFSSNPANDVEIATYGVAWKPHHQIVIKLDYMDVDNEAGSGQDQINIAMGYVF